MKPLDLRLCEAGDGVRQEGALSGVTGRRIESGGQNETTLSE